MTVSRVNPLTATQPVEEESNRSQASHDDPHRSEQSAQPGPPQSGQSVRKHRDAPRANLLANSARAGVGARKVTASSTGVDTGVVWNKGLTLACELVATMVPSGHVADSSARLSLHAFEKWIRPLATAVERAPTASDFLRNMISRLKDGDESAEPHAELLEKLQGIVTDQDGDSALGFYAVMAIMATAAGIATTIRAKKPDVSTAVTRQVQQFVTNVPALLESTSRVESSQTIKLIAMARLAMKVPFEYRGTAIPATLTHSMMKWHRAVSGAATRESQEKLVETIGSFLDALIGEEHV